MTGGEPSHFRNANQALNVARTLAGLIGKDAFWDVAGPSPALVEAMNAGLPGLSLNQRLYTQISWIVWSLEHERKSPVDVSVWLMLSVLHGPYLRPLASLIHDMSMGPDAVDGWIARYQGKSLGME